MMLVRDIGEFELIDILKGVIADGSVRANRVLEGQGFSVLRSIGDDAAAWRSPEGIRVFTTDTMVEGVHFELRYTGWRDLGWKALATNYSDVAAMGCAPSMATVTLGLRGDIPVDGLIEMYRGMMGLVERCGGAVVGGDIVKTPAFFISVGLEGFSRSGDPNTLLLRDSAKHGELIAVTGTLGSSGAGLKLMSEGADESGLGSYGFLRDAHNRPMPRISEGETLARLGVRCAMDISDGLVEDLGKLCRASAVGAQIHAADIPVDSRLKATFPSSWLSLALGGGEDYELLFTAPGEVMHSVRDSVSTKVTVIGEVIGEGQGVTVLDENGQSLPVGSGGWDHFRT